VGGLVRRSHAVAIRRAKSPSVLRGTRYAADAGGGCLQLHRPASDSDCITFAANTGADSASTWCCPWSTAGTSQTSAPFTLQSRRPWRRSRCHALRGRRRAVGARQQLPSIISCGSSGAIVVIRWRIDRANHRRRAAAVTAAGPTDGRQCPNIQGLRDQDCRTLNNVGAVARLWGCTSPSTSIRWRLLRPSAADLDSLKTVFDTRLYPLDTTTFGHVSDIDTNTVSSS